MAKLAQRVKPQAGGRLAAHDYELKQAILILLFRGWLGASLRRAPMAASFALLKKSKSARDGATRPTKSAIDRKEAIRELLN
jgi:hypothetical protein